MKESEKCNSCKDWAFGCELNGIIRRYCKSTNYSQYRPKETFKEITRKEVKI